jgi:hypothetical protein
MNEKHHVHNAFSDHAAWGLRQRSNSFKLESTKLQTLQSHLALVRLVNGCSMAPPVVVAVPVQSSVESMTVEEERTAAYCGPLTCLCAVCCWCICWPCTILALCCPCDETQVRTTRQYRTHEAPR